MQTTGTITNIDRDINTRKYKISILVDTNNIDTIEELKKENKLSFELKKYRKKRSLDANAYCWVLCDMIAKELSKEVITTKEEVYKEAIMQIGRFTPFIVEERALENFKRVWEKQGLGFTVQEVARKDKRVRVNGYYGSSSYDSKEMSLLIEWIIQEAKQLGLETKSKNEIDSLLKQWETGTK